MKGGRRRVVELLRVIPHGEGRLHLEGLKRRAAKGKGGDLRKNSLNGMTRKEQLY